MDLLDRQREVELLMEQYRILTPDKNENKLLNREALSQLKIGRDSAIADIMEWAVYTEGINSPAVIALGKVEIWYGIEAEAFKGLYQLFWQQQGQSSEGL